MAQQEPSVIEMKKQCRQALAQVLTYYGTKAKIARDLGFSRNTIGFWWTRGKIGRKGAIAVEKACAGMFTKEYLRPDIADWRPVRDRKKKVAE